MEILQEALVFYTLIMASYYVLIVIPAYILWSGLTRIPEHQREFNPAQVWLVCIPLIGLVFLWIYLPFKIPSALRSSIPAEKIKPSEDFGKLYGMMTAISYTCMYIPFLDMLAIFTTPVLFTLYLAHFSKVAQLVSVDVRIKEKDEPVTQDAPSPRHEHQTGQHTVSEDRVSKLREALKDKNSFVMTEFTDFEHVYKSSMKVLTNNLIGLALLFAGVLMIFTPLVLISLFVIGFGVYILVARGADMKIKALEEWVSS